MTKENVKEISIVTVLGERYLSYAMSTIMSRSLPDVRDGLKPVHRRLLYAMRELNLMPNHNYKKCARVVGDVIGKYHPHGEASVYDALVRLAQHFAVRYPLVDGQGNFGNIDGDNAAAMRYTESKLTPVAMNLMEGLDENAVDFKTTYDGEEKEPLVLPSSFPNLLANGSLGIAVGMSTSVPPHNVDELCQALIHIIEHPNCSMESILSFIPGPDFPTGGTMMETARSIQTAYEQGRGSFRVRSRFEIEYLKNGSYQIVVTEIPYMVAKNRLIEQLADIVENKKIPLLADIRDESTMDIRLILEPKNRNVDPEVLMEYLFRATDLETKFHLNLNVLDLNGVPGVMSLPQILRAFLEHRYVILKRRSEYQLNKIDRRLEVLNGYLVVYLNIDRVIEIIRNEDHPKEKLIAEFHLTEVQAESVLNLRLRSLRKLEEFEIRQEHDELSKKLNELKLLLSDENLQGKTIKNELKQIRKLFGQHTELGKRRTIIVDPVEKVLPSLEEQVESEPVTVVCSDRGWIRAFKGHNVDKNELKFKEGDSVKFVFECMTTDKLLIFVTNGKFFTLSPDKLPHGRGYGEPIHLMVDIGEEKIISMFPLSMSEDKQLLLMSTDGYGFTVNAKEVVAQTKTGKQILNVKDDVKAFGCRFVDGDHLAIVGENRKLLIFPLDQIPTLQRGKGVRLQRYKQGGVSDVRIFTLETGLNWISRGKEVLETKLTPWMGSRASVGRLAPNGFPKNNQFS